MSKYQEFNPLPFGCYQIKYICISGFLTHNLNICLFYFPDIVFYFFNIINYNVYQIKMYTSDLYYILFVCRQNILTHRTNSYIYYYL